MPFYLLKSVSCGINSRGIPVNLEYHQRIRTRAYIRLNRAQMSLLAFFEPEEVPLVDAWQAVGNSYQHVKNTPI